MPEKPPALVMNMFYTGLGIARTLGQHGIPVIGLSSVRGGYGNFTRYARTVLTPDSRHEPEALLETMLRLGEKLGRRSVVFPTRDDDLQFLDRYREQLSPHFNLVIPERSVLETCLDKWETSLWAKQAAVATPRCWMVESEEDLLRLHGDLSFPCVMKPIASHHWRLGSNWKTVGERKAIGVSSWSQLLAEYAVISQAGKRVLLQEMIEGPDNMLVIMACYFDRKSNCLASFNTRKLLQSPESFGTGCIVQAENHPELYEPSVRLLKAINFTGIAEVEYKWDAVQKDFSLIEVNARPWDQHRLGYASGNDLIYLAYCEHAELPMPPAPAHAFDTGQPVKWVAEDSLLFAILRMLRRRDPRWRSLSTLLRGKRIYALWSVRDPLPLFVFVFTQALPDLVASMVGRVTAALKACWTFGGARSEKRLEGRGL